MHYSLLSDRKSTLHALLYPIRYRLNIFLSEIKTNSGKCTSNSCLTSRNVLYFHWYIFTDFFFLTGWNCRPVTAAWYFTIPNCNCSLPGRELMNDVRCMLNSKINSKKNFSKVMLSSGDNPLSLCICLQTYWRYGPGSSVGIATKDWIVRGMNHGRVRFSALPDRPWGPPSLL